MSKGKYFNDKGVKVKYTHDFVGKYVDKDKNVYYYVDGLLHREDKPAIEMVNGDKHWYYKGVPHRIDGPAVMYNSDKKDEFYYMGKKIEIDDFLIDNPENKK